MLMTRPRSWVLPAGMFVSRPGWHADVRARTERDGRPAGGPSRKSHAYRMVNIFSFILLPPRRATTLLRTNRNAWPNAQSNRISPHHLRQHVNGIHWARISESLLGLGEITPHGRPCSDNDRSRLAGNVGTQSAVCINSNLAHK